MWEHDKVTLSMYHQQLTFDNLARDLCSWFAEVAGVRQSRCGVSASPVVKNPGKYIPTTCTHGLISSYFTHLVFAG